MNRTRWLAALLVVSWTLNVALGVALYYRHYDRIPPHIGPFGMDGPGGPPPPIGCIPPEERRMMRTIMAPLAEDQQRLSEELMLALTSDSLDTAKVMSYSDSLGKLKWQMQEMMVKHMTSIHDQIPSDKRRELCKRMIGRFEHPKNKRGEHKRDRSEDR